MAKPKDNGAKKERPVREAVYNSGKPVPVVYQPEDSPTPRTGKK